MKLKLTPCPFNFQDCQVDFIEHNIIITRNKEREGESLIERGQIKNIKKQGKRKILILEDYASPKKDHIQFKIH